MTTGPRQEFDLQPDPRILPMLGEINLAQWRCLAELVDNSVDGFLAAARQGEAVVDPRIEVNIPTADVASGRVTVRDNGPGMPPETLEKAVRAGWTGNSPIGNLGMFGMGFNIATARLGVVTTVWTATPNDSEWHGLKIDFDELRRQRHFKTPHLARPKADPADHGTEVIIERLKPEQRLWLAKPANLSQARKNLSEAYGAMLRAKGVPISFQLTVNGRRLTPKNHCVWDDTRTAETTRWGSVPAFIIVDRRLPDRPYCTSCWQWLSAEDTTCPACGSTGNVVQRQRHVHGWIGLQRYLSTSEFGIDFIRNGRKIEIANKDLFDWREDSISEREYPIDDPRNRGRFVGEIHLDHCRVTYTKDRFDRTDPAWEEMTRIVRGEGPLRPEKAASAGYGPNDSPLFRLFQAFRRSSPPNARIAGGWAKVLAVKDNERAEEMAKLFHKGEAEYQTDSKWWDLIVEEDNRLLTPSAPGATPPAGASGSPGTLGGFSAGGTDGEGQAGSPAQGAVPAAPPPPPPPRTPIPSLTREYRHDGTNLRWDVHAFEVMSNDPVLGDSAEPWRMTRRTTGDEDLFLNTQHQVFRSATMTPLDAVLCQLAWSASDFMRGQPDAPTFASVLADLRERYAATLKLDPVAIKAQADFVFSSIAKAWARDTDEEDCKSLFNDDLSQTDRDTIYSKMAIRTVGNPQQVIARGRFLEFAPPRVLAEFVVKHPELFFDGRCWDDTYSEIEFPTDTATQEAQSRVVRHYEALLLDVVWLAEQEAEDLVMASRERILRAALAIDLLTPTSADATDANG